MPVSRPVSDMLDFGETQPTMHHSVALACLLRQDIVKAYEASFHSRF